MLLTGTVPLQYGLRLGGVLLVEGVRWSQVGLVEMSPAGVVDSEINGNALVIVEAQCPAGLHRVVLRVLLHSEQ